MTEKKRLDLIVAERGLTSSRERAKTLIMEGKVFVNGIREDKPGTSFAEDKIETIEVRGETLPYVSRGGLKLEKAIKEWGIDLKDKTCLDIGASTGGFTDCMLQNGAKKVYAVDVGYGQLDYKLRSDDRVVCMEKTNFRYLKEEDLPEKADFASADVSFISLNKIFPAAYPVLTEEAEMVALIKPQFEAGRDKVGKKGVVRDAAVHEEVMTRVIRDARETGFSPSGVTFSPVRGAEGNIEYLLYLKKTGEEKDDVSPEEITDIVRRAHEANLSDHQ